METSSRHSKYRLFNLEKKFTNESGKAKDQLETISKKLNVLQNLNQTQQDQMRQLDSEKRETYSTVTFLQTRIKDL